jgi:hypothetical protein
MPSCERNLEDSSDEKYTNGEQIDAKHPPHPPCALFCATTLRDQLGHHAHHTITQRRKSSGPLQPQHRAPRGLSGCWQAVLSLSAKRFADDTRALRALISW